jgi:iron complex transport system ATP-binding protein
MIHLEQLSYILGEKRILHNVNLHIRSGEFLGLIGPNGAGKSTLLKIIAGLLPPTQGKVWMNHHDLFTLSPRSRAQSLAFMPQNTTLDFQFSCWDVVMMGRNPHIGLFEAEMEKDRRIVEEAMELTGTLAFKERMITDLSGGQRQLVVLARALAQQPQILLLDEPTSHLDIHHQLDIFERVQTLVKKGITVVAAIHDLNMAARFCDRLVLIHNGEIVCSGTPNDVITTEKIHKVFDIDALVSKEPVINTLKIIPLGSFSHRKEDKSNHRIHVISGSGHAGFLLRELDEEGYSISTGVLHTDDPDYEVAKTIDIPVVAVPPYCPINDQADKENRSLIREADCVIIAEVPIGLLNLCNVEAALQGEKILLINGDSLDQRDYTGGKANHVITQLKERAVSISKQDLLQKLKEILEYENHTQWSSQELIVNT